MPALDVMTIREMIDAAFGETNSSCPVNFQMLGTVLYILARRMELLKRQFKLKLAQPTSNLVIPKSSFILTEIKIHSNKRKQFRKSKIQANERLPNDKKSTGKYKRFTQKRSRKTSTHRTPTKKLSIEDSSSGTLSDDEVIRKKSPTVQHKNIKYMPDKRFAEICLFGQRETEDYFIGLSPDIQRKAGNNFDEKSTPIKRKTGGHLDEISRRKTRKYSHNMLPAQQRRDKKYNSQYGGENDVSDDTDDYIDNEKIFLGVSHASVSRIASEGRWGGIKRPNLKITKKKKKIDLDDFDVCVIRRKIHEFYRVKKEIPTKKIADCLKEDSVFVARTPSGTDFRESTAILNPVVTHEQFERLLDKTRALQKKYGITSTRKAKWDDLRSLRSISSMMHPGVALNISERLDEAESRLERMLDVVEQFAQQVPKIQSFIDDQYLPMDERENLKVHPSSLPTLKSEDKKISRQVKFESELDVVKAMPSVQSMNVVTQTQFQNQLQRMRNTVFINIRKEISNINVEKCKEALSKHDQNINKMRKKINSIVELERAIGGFGKKVAAIDHIINFEMTAWQETLQYMQNDLENGLDKLNEALMSPKEDVAAVAQTTEAFNYFKRNLDDTGFKQVNLEKDMALYSLNLESVEKNMEVVFDLKCSRKEMYDVLNKKVSLKSFNGLLTQELFCAVNADMKKKLQTMYFSLFLLECDWQKKIDEFKKRKYEFADRIQLVTLKRSMRDYIISMDKNVKEMLAIVGPLKRYPTNKVLERDGKCLSCGKVLETVKEEFSVKYWKQISNTSPEATVKSNKTKDQEIATMCIPRRPIPHPLEQDSYICQHDCGDIVYTNAKLFDLFVKELKPIQINSEAKTHEDKDYGILH